MVLNGISRYPPQHLLWASTATADATPKGKCMDVQRKDWIVVVLLVDSPREEDDDDDDLRQEFLIPRE